MHSPRVSALGLTALLAALGAAAQAADPQPGSASAAGAHAEPPDRVHPAWAAFEPEFRPHVCPFPATPGENPDEFRCGYVMVPEDRTDPGSRLIRLSVLKVASTSPDPYLGAIVRLDGGPGGPSLSAGRVTAYRRSENAPLRAAADLIFFDQRGVGYSEGHFCRAVTLPYQTGLPIDGGGQADFQAALERCFEEARAGGIAVEGYTNWQNALDVRDLRRALGYESWSLFGVSYGTELAQGVMRVDAAGVRAAVLDSPVPAGYATNNLDGMYAAGFRSALDAIDRMCAADPACAAAYPGLAQRFISAFAAYDETPLRLSRVNHRRARDGELLIDGDLAAGAIFQALYRASVYPSLPAMLHVLESRDEAALRAYVDVLGWPIDHTFGHGMSVTISCRGGFREDPGAPPPHGAPEPLLSQWMDTTQFWTGCEPLAGTAPDPTARPLVSDIPTLILTGEADPITPPYYADVMMPGLANAQRVGFPHTGHGALITHWDRCGRDLLMAYLTNPMTPLEASCAAETPAPDFLVKMRLTREPYRFGLKLQRQDYPWLTIGAGGLLALLLLAFPLGTLARQIDSRRSGDYGRARTLTWIGAGLSLAGAALALHTILFTAEAYPAALPVGVPASIGWAGWLALIGFVLCLAGLVQLARNWSGPSKTAGTRLAILFAALASGALLWFLFRIGAGPVVL